MRPPRIVLFGLSLSSAWGNGHATTYRALVKGLAAAGCEVHFCERRTRWYADTADLGTADLGAADPAAAAPPCTLHFYDDLTALADLESLAARADVIVIGSYVPDGAAVAAWALRLARGRVAFYDIDTPVTLEALDAGACAYLDAAQIPDFAAYFSFTGGPTLARLGAAYGARAPTALYCGVDTALYRPVRVASRWAMSYLGTYSADRQAALDRVLCGAARARPDLRFCVAGALYPAGLDWPANVERIEHVPPARHPAFYGASRLTLNLTRAPMRRAGYSPSVRLFEAAACGAAIVSDTWDGLSAVFDPGAEIIAFADTASGADLLSRAPDDVARRIGLAARRRAVRDHDGAARAHTLLAAFDLARPPGRHVDR